MRRGRVFIYIALILLLALGGGYWFLTQNSSESASAVPTPSLTEVLVVAQPIPLGGTITEENLTTVPLPQDKIVEVMFTTDQREDVLGKVAKYPLEQGVMITRSMIGEPGEITASGPEWVSLISPGMTAIAIPTSRLASVAYGIGDGAHVNVIACFLFVDVDPAYQSILPNHTSLVSGATEEQQYVVDAESSSSFSESDTTGNEAVQRQDPSQGRVELDPALQQPFYVIPSEAQRARPVCQQVFQDVVVMRLGNFPLKVDEAAKADLSEEEQAGAQPAPAPAADTRPPDIVTLMVSPQDAVTLTYLMYGGANLTLTLRGSTDTARFETEAATLQFVLSQYAIPIPAKLPYATEPRITALEAPSLPNDSVSTSGQ